ncbi:hypothetical protein DLD77_05115 [Chitinophaga alhagiae]|uniref:Glycosyl hydrolase-like 10 domain-containing protein n=1 Tax=Chitinophaga alhagiae TaxID=2203219 RepID=A0ABM6WB00_9BACT|nr:family 10 glycosylhydrolase [Chitinophaga alhagiae]AWO01115.1 hypothetical protein DLD77_05115 [Chitinophaga alhagiae]
MQKFCYVAMILLACACMPAKKTTKIASHPKATAEFRAAWVATVANINWPSRPGLTTAQQQEEAIRLLNFLADHNFNAVIFQVRPQADALYQSSLEPWSYYLTGRQGQAPAPFYDPLAFWVEEAHKRGLELHVWLNPYRAHHVAGGEVTDSSVVKKMPSLVVHLKEGYWWFDPAKKGTQDHAAAVVHDIVSRYDIDGVHFDDYFYPYPSYNGGEDFPDKDSWAAYQQSGGKLSRADWRRHAVNIFIKRLYKEIKATKKHVKFGLSPFGVWRPGYPSSTVGGFDQYADLYADARLWLNKGWIDYFSPQLYWPINRIPVSFPVLLGWWQRENTQQRHLWPGISVGRDTGRLSQQETMSQIMITRGIMPDDMGVIHWHVSSVANNPNMAQALLNGPYQQGALVPPSPWLNNTLPAAPAVSMEEQADSVRISWEHPDAEPVFRWVVYYKYGSRWAYTIYPKDTRAIAIPAKSGPYKLAAAAVTAVGRTGNESPFAAKLLEVAIVPRSGWNANTPGPYRSQQPVRITIHHEGTRFDSTQDAPKHIRNVQVWGMGKDRNWADIPYHFLIAPDGTIYEGRNVFTAGETATEYDPQGHLLITCMGNFEEQAVDPRQLDALVRLTAYACRKYNIPYSTIASHKDHSTQTVCPGKNLYQYIRSGYITEQVKSLVE